VETEGQIDWGGYNNRFGTLHIASARAQVDYQVSKWEFGARYAVLSMDSNAGFFLAASAPPAGETMASQAVDGGRQWTPGMGKPIHEITPSITYHFRDHTMKLVADLPIYLDCPLYIAAGDGAYVFSDQGGASPGWDEVQVADAGTGSSMVRRATVEARMMFQFQF
jgi:hypothetical protein